MGKGLREVADRILADGVGRLGGAPGIVAIATDRGGNFYEGAAGVREFGASVPMDTDSVFFIASCTKAITGITVMQLIEEGKVGLDDRARDYVPEIGALQVLEGFAPDGEPRLRAPRSDVTVGQLLLHTGGFGYDFFNPDLLRYREVRGIPSVLSSTFASIQDVLVTDPGTRWEYGCGIDWAGKVVEAVRGQRLGAVMRERVFEPLGMRDIGFVMTPSMLERRVTLHQRAPDGQLTPQPELVLPQDPEMDMGGHALYATIPEYLKFIRMLLNDGAGAHGRVLEPATVERLATNGLGALKLSPWTTCNPFFANSGDFFPGQSKSWAYTFMVNDEDTPSGRPAGSLMWAGIANSYYWIDRRNGIGGMWSAQVLPFQDIGCYPGFVDFETAVYHALARGELGRGAR